jgi:hypothetical protein
MTNRREFLQTGLAASALPLSINGLLSSDAAANALPALVPLRKAIFDGRYAEGRLFAGEVGRLGVPLQPLDVGDVTPVFEELDLLWRKHPVGVAGLTQYGPMFVLEQLARERGMRVVLRVEHRARPGGTLAHEVSADPETAALADRLSERGLEWPAMMAVLAARCRTGGACRSTHTVVTPGAAPVLTAAGAPSPESVIHYYAQSSVQTGRGIALDGPLFSWTIARAA